jgi:glutamate carboxypeptidase
MAQTATFAPLHLPTFRARQAEFLERLALLVNIDSGSGQVEGVSRIMDHLSRWYTALGFTVALHTTPRFGQNLVARRRGSGQKRVLLVGHVDTVYSAGAVETQPFTIRDNRAYGPGVVDMKSGVLLGLYALTALLETGFDDYGELVVVCNNDEEVGSPESTPLLSEIARQVDVGLVLEPSSSPGLITGARKGTAKYMLKINGTAAHSGGEPHKGRSAVLELAHKIIAIQNLHALFPGVTFNMTNLSSSEALNVIPDLARCSISVRAYRQKGLDLAAEALEQVVASCSVPGTRAILTRLPAGRRPYQSTPEVQALVTQAQLEGESLGVRLEPETKGGVSDANVLMGEGLPTLDGLGPIGGGMHNLALEHLDLETLAMRGALLTGLLQRVCLS